MPLSPALHSIVTIQKMERTALDVLPAFTLMQRAGAAAIALAMELLSIGATYQTGSSGTRRPRQQWQLCG